MNKRRKSHGFTIVELIVVVTLIAVLASISYFILSGWRVETARTEVKNDLQNIESELNAYRTFNNGFPSTLTAVNYDATASVDSSYSLRTDDTYCLNASSNVEPTVSYFIDTRTNKHLAEGSCTP